MDKSCLRSNCGNGNLVLSDPHEVLRATAMKSNRSVMHETVSGGMDALVAQSFRDNDAEALLIALITIGDALRLEAILPGGLVKRFQAEVPVAQFEAVLESLTASIDAWSIPRTIDQDDDSPSLVWALRSRDEVESVRVAVRRILCPLGILIDRSLAAKRLTEALAVHDLTCGGKLSRSEAERMLGDRSELLDQEGSWLDQFWA